MREVCRVLVEECPYGELAEFGYATFPVHADISTVNDILRIGAPALAIRFREVDPMAWQTLIELLVA